MPKTQNEILMIQQQFAKKLNALIAERQKQEKRSSPGSEGTKAWDT